MMGENEMAGESGRMWEGISRMSCGDWGKGEESENEMSCDSEACVPNSNGSPIHTLTMDGLTSLVSVETGVPVNDIYTRTLEPRVVHARYMIMVLACRWFGYSYRQIAENIGCRHTLVQYAMKRHGVLLENDDWYANAWEVLDDTCARLARDRMVGKE